VAWEYTKVHGLLYASAAVQLLWWKAVHSMVLVAAHSSTHLNMQCLLLAVLVGHVCCLSLRSGWHAAV
jgi:hypothetical protein